MIPARRPFATRCTARSRACTEDDEGKSLSAARRPAAIVRRTLHLLGTHLLLIVDTGSFDLGELLHRVADAARKPRTERYLLAAIERLAVSFYWLVALREPRLHGLLGQPLRGLSVLGTHRSGDEE